MNIGIDARLLERKITGIGRSLELLLKEIPKVDKKNKYYIFTYEPISFESDFYINISTVKNFLPSKIFSPLWSNFFLPIYLKKHNIDILFSINQIVPLIKISSCKYISVVHDVIFKADPNFLPFIYRKYLQFFAFFSIRISDVIITISEYSKKDILKHYKIDENKIKVIYQSANPEFVKENIDVDEKNALKRKLKLKEHIILYVGKIENRKNILGIIKVANELKKNFTDFIFVLVGKVGYGGEKILAQVNKNENIKHLSNVDDKLLKKLYNISDVFIFPSLYEGFGYPPLEAMQCALPVISSNNTSLIEVVGEGGILHDPMDYKAMSRSIVKIISDKTFCSQIKKKSLIQANKFSLNKTAKEIVSVFNSI